jgi:glycine/D-amino acid oxidase-like deaminating enzyme
MDFARAAAIFAALMVSLTALDAPAAAGAPAKDPPSNKALNALFEREFKAQQAALPDLVDELRGRLARRQPALATAEALEAKIGLYDITPDWHPLLGRVPEVDGLLLVTGGSGLDGRDG